MLPGIEYNHYKALIIHTRTILEQVMNDVVFPTRLDFGSHALGQTVSRTVKLECKVKKQSRKKKSSQRDVVYQVDNYVGCQLQNNARGL